MTKKVDEVFDAEAQFNAFKKQFVEEQQKEMRELREMNAELLRQNQQKELVKKAAQGRKERAINGRVLKDQLKTRTSDHYQVVESEKEGVKMTVTTYGGKRD